MKVFNFEDANITWFLFLIGTCVASFIAAVFSNLASNTPRSHSFVKFVNESLGRMQFGFVTFYLSLLAASDLDRTQINAIRLVQVLILGSVAIWGVSLFIIRNLPEMIIRFTDHRCTQLTDGICQDALGWDSLKKVSWINFALFVFLFLVSAYITVSPIIATQQKHQDNKSEQSVPKQN